MYRVSLRFYAELNDFLPRQQRQVRFLHTYRERSSIKDVVESLGVPHPEIDLLLVDDRSVGFDYLLQDSDRVSAYPYFSSLDISSLSKVRPQPPAPLRFIADVHLGKLARSLRMLGFDVLYSQGYTDEDLATRSSQEGRILLTRDRPLLKRSQVTYGYCVRSSDPRQQLLEILQRYRGFDAAQPFQRCLRCNHLTQAVPKVDIAQRLPPFVRANHTDFRMCPGCDRIYWKGTHYERMQEFCTEVLNAFRRTGSGP